MTFRTRTTDVGANPLPRLIVRYIALVVSITAILTAYVGWKNSNDLRDGLVQSCATNGNPLRLAVTTLIQSQIDQSHSLDLELFFPDIPPAQLHELIHRQNQRRLKLLRQIQPVDCQSLYR